MVLYFAFKMAIL